MVWVLICNFSDLQKLSDRNYTNSGSYVSIEILKQNPRVCIKNCWFRKMHLLISRLLIANKTRLWGKGILSDLTIKYFEELKIIIKPK